MRISDFWRAWLAVILISISASGYAQSSLGYDSSADPFSLLQDAKVRAADDSKHILVIAGGEWCVWCHYLDAFLVQNPDVGEALKDTFVVVKAYLGAENDNEAFFSAMPEAVGYPHFWVLASDGTVLISQNTLPLEDGDKSYDKGRFVAFINMWKMSP